MLFIEDFEIDRTAQKLSKNDYETIPRNINHDYELAKKTSRLLDAFLRVRY